MHICTMRALSLAHVGLNEHSEDFARLLDVAFNPMRFISPVSTRTGVVAERHLFFRDSYDQRRTYLISDGALNEDPLGGDGLDDDSDF